MQSGQRKRASLVTLINSNVFGMSSLASPGWPNADDKYPKGTSSASVCFWLAYCQGLLVLVQLRLASLVSRFALHTRMQMASWFLRSTSCLPVCYAHKC